LIARMQARGLRYKGPQTAGWAGAQPMALRIAVARSGVWNS